MTILAHDAHNATAHDDRCADAARGERPPLAREREVGRLGVPRCGPRAGAAALAGPPRAGSRVAVPGCESDVTSGPVRRPLRRPDGRAAPAPSPPDVKGTLRHLLATLSTPPLSRLARAIRMFGGATSRVLLRRESPPDQAMDPSIQEVVMRSFSARRLLATCVVSAAGLAALVAPGIANAEIKLEQCKGSNITGAGSSFQLEAQEVWKGTFHTSGCENGLPGRPDDQLRKHRQRRRLQTLAGKRRIRPRKVRLHRYRQHGQRR